MVERMIMCPDCHSMQYGWDGLKRHFIRFVKHKMSPEEAEDKVQDILNAHLAMRELEHQWDDEYDRKHNLGAYSY